MAIIKEFHCGSCDRDFESTTPVCGKCGRIAKRVFLTPPHVSTGYAKRCDAIMESEFKARGITNFSNTGSVPKVTMKDHFNSPGNAPEVVQPGTVAAGWGGGVLKHVPGAEAVAPALPNVANLPGIPLPGVKVGRGGLGGLGDHTEVIGREYTRADLNRLAG
jgi:hypothetical protein